MHDPMKDLKDFHDKFGDPDRLTKPITLELLKKRRKLMWEEFKEVIDQLDDLTYHVINWEDIQKDEEAPGIDYLIGQWEHMAKELADALYVIYGTAEELSLDLYAAFDRTHQSNMDKLWPDGQVHYNEYGKVIKPPTYKAPDLKGVVNDRVLPTNAG